MTLGGGVQRDCADKPYQAAMLFNSKFSAELDDLNNNLPNPRVIYVDIYPLLDMIVNLTYYGNFTLNHIINHLISLKVFFDN